MSEDISLEGMSVVTAQVKKWQEEIIAGGEA